MDAIANSFSTTNATSSARGFNDLSSQDFTKLIISELTKQDPLEPNDTNALLGQISTIRSIESDTKLSDSLSSLVKQNDFSSAATLIGKSISGVSNGNQRVEGVVESISRTKDGTTVRLANGDTLKWSNVDSVKTLP